MSGEPERRLCADCRHCYKAPFVEAWAWLCIRPVADNTLLHVTGKTSRSLDKPAHEERSAEGSCGPDARFWEARPAEEPAPGSVIATGPSEPKGGILAYLRALFG